MAMTTTTTISLVALLVVLPGHLGAPRSKSSHRSGPQTVYDQKQTGDYNIQLHLKDFQIIALLGDDSLGVGDYDYNYDYADFTVKPSTNKPSTESPPPSTSSTPLKPTKIEPSTVSPPKESPTDNKEQPPLNPDPAPIKLESNSSALESATKINITKDVVEIVESSTIKQSEKLEETNSPGKIKVQIIETPVGIVPGEVTDEQEGVNHGEVFQVRRCGTGFARDKKGRCRRVRRPQISYGIGRLANNLASRFRYTSSEESLSSIESTEE